MSIDVNQMRTTPPGYFTVRWGLPEYTDWIDETNSWKETCYIGDWSFLWERRFKGRDVLKLFSDISVNSFAKFDVGQSKHVIHCNKARLASEAHQSDGGVCAVQEGQQAR